MGGSQKWYPTFWRRLSGCGPANAALLAWYLAQSDVKYQALCTVKSRSKDEFLTLMNEMFAYVKPGLRGVYTPEMFTKGFQRFATKKGVMPPRFSTLKSLEKAKFSFDEVLKFVLEAVQNDVPVAFMNLHSGNQRNVEDYHWLTIYAVDCTTGVVQCCDKGATQEFSLREWLVTSKRGGAFVTINKSLIGDNE
jgi:hypothetical protein